MVTVQVMADFLNIKFIIVFLQVLFFAKSRELTGCSQTQLTTPSLTTGGALLEAIVNAHPEYVINYIFITIITIIIIIIICFFVVVIGWV